MGASIQEELAARQLHPEDPEFGVNWFEAVNYCCWLTPARGFGKESQSYAKLHLTEVAASSPGLLDLSANTELPMRLENPGFRLPTEAEWEHVAHADNERA